MSKKGRTKGSNTGMSKYEVVREISNATQLKPEVVRAVLDSWSDIAAREIVLYGNFHWEKLFSVRTKLRPEHKGYNVRTKEWEILPDSHILQMSISNRLRTIWKIKNRNILNAQRGVDKDNWRDYYKTNNNDKKESEI